MPDKDDFAMELSAGVDVYFNKMKEDTIHYAAKNGNENALRDLLKCPKTNINNLDSDKNSALYLATKAGHVECTRLLLKSKHIKPNEVNPEDKNPVYVAAISKREDDDLMRLFIKCPKVNLDKIVLKKPLREWITENYPHFAVKKYDDPFDYLKTKDVKGFIKYLSFTRLLKRDDEENKEHTYLQYACDLGLLKVVKALLKFGAEPNKTTKNNNNLPVFIASSKGYAEIIKLFLDCESFVEFHSKKEGSVIHQVLKGWAKNSHESDVKNELCNYEKSFEILLKECDYNLKEGPKININCVDGNGDTCLNIAVKLGRKKIVFDLLDHNAYIDKIKGCRNPVIAEISREMLESYLDSCIGRNKKSPYHIDLSYKFLCPPLDFIHKNFDNDAENYKSQKEIINSEEIVETDLLLHLSEVPTLKPLLVHPVISSFIFFKWHKIKIFYYINFLLYLLFLIILSIFIIFHDKSVLLKTYGLVWFLVLFGNISVCFRELAQFITCPKKYIMNYQNWIEIFMIILIYCVIFERLNDVFRIQATAIVLLLSWGQILFFIGRHPAHAINLEIFKVVTVNFLKFIIWFATLIVAFILCFCMLFGWEKHQSNILDILEHILLMSFKTVLMLTGEFDMEEKEFGLFPYSIISHVLFVLFIFLINIVFVNLLSGLAVSDIQQIKHESKIIAMTSNVRFVHDFEILLHQNNLISYIYSICVKLKLPFCKKLESFPEGLERPFLTVKSNQNFQEKVANAVFDGIYLDDEDMMKAISICEYNMKESKESCMDIYEKFNSIEKSMKDLKKMLKDMK